MSLEAERSKFDPAAVNVADRVQVARYYKELTTFDDKVDELLQDLHGRFGLSSDELLEIFTRSGVSQPYEGLILWVRERQSTLRNNARTVVKESETVKIRVSAFQSSNNGQDKRVHVANYDNIPAAQPTEQQSLGLKLTGTEQKQLEAELKGNQLAIQRSSQLVTYAARTVDNLSELFDSLGQKLARSREGLNSLAATRATLAKIQQAVGSRQDLDQRRISSTLSQVDSQLTALEQTVGCLDSIQNLITTTRSLKLSELLAGSGHLLENVADCQDNVESTLDGIGGVLSDSSGISILNSLNLSLDGLKGIAKSGVEEPLREFHASLDSIAALFQFNAEAGKQLLPGVSAATEFQPTSSDYILQDLPNAPDAVVQLADLELTDGAQLTVNVDFLDKTDGSILSSVQYRLTTRWFGLHRKINGQTIFWKNEASSGPFRADIAAVASWQYRYRNASSGFQRFLNSWQPGFGIHLANVREGAQTLGYGLGLNLSLGDNIIGGGYGWNLSENQNGYWLIGVNLLPVIQSFNK